MIYELGREIGKEESILLYGCSLFTRLSATERYALMPGARARIMLTDFATEICMLMIGSQPLSIVALLSWFVCVCEGGGG